MKDLSIIIPARNEIFIGITIQNLLDNLEGDTDIIAVLDGYTVPIPEIPHDPKVSIIGHTTSVGQRAACNEAARLSTSKYIMKLDAHCAIEKGMDVKMLADMKDDWTFVPTMRNLWAFDWKCPEGHTRYQGPSGPCTVCGKETIKDMKWIAKDNPQSNSYCFDTEPHFQYFREFNKRPEGKGDLTESMSLQGSCFMVTRDKYFELNICDEAFGSWGSQGIETAVKTWLSGGKVMVNHKTYYAHCFRTQGGDFGFPYPISGKQVGHAKKTAKKLFFENKWEKQIYPLSWLIEKFYPVPGWSDVDIAKLKGELIAPIKPLIKSILYYTDNNIDEKVLNACQKQLSTIGLPIVSVSLKPIDFGTNIVVEGERSPLTMFKQILAGLESSSADIIYFCEHDCLYHQSHFELEKIERDTFYYNENVWFLRLKDGHCLHYNARQLSGLCAYREELIIHYRERIKLCEEIGFSRNIGFEPMNHHRIKWNNFYKVEGWESSVANVDIKHDKNLLHARWSIDQFRNKKPIKYWVESKNFEILGWENIKEVLN